LIVGNPTGDLPAAGDEALAVHRRFYSEGTYFGVPGEIAGSPDDVLDWLTARPAGRAVLHLACHAVADPARPADARLVLAGGDLSVRLLLDRSRQSALRVDQVFLAACSTGAVSDDYDEALSLATSFLAAGARTVIGSLWPVPDDATALLMYLVHHYLRDAGCDPATALHRAQLWMLDPGRTLPAGTPEWLVRRHRAAGAVPDPSAWAGFIHLGG
jgi:CHAT domain-containing protein